MRRPTWVSNSVKALQATEYAKEHGAFDAVSPAFYRAYWEEGKDIGELEVIREVIEGAGLAWGPLEAALAENAYLDSVLGQFHQATDIHFDGIPAFIIGNLRFTGAQPMEVFRAVAERAKEALAEDPEAFGQIRGLL